MTLPYLNPVGLRQDDFTPIPYFKLVGVRSKGRFQKKSVNSLRNMDTN